MNRRILVVSGLLLTVFGGCDIPTGIQQPAPQTRGVETGGGAARPTRDNANGKPAAPATIESPAKRAAETNASKEGQTQDDADVKRYRDSVRKAKETLNELNNLF